MSRLAVWPFPAVFLFLVALYLLAGQLAAPGFKRSSNAVSPPASRLNLTLKGNEARYQAAVRERKASIEKIGHSVAACVYVSANSIADC